jgi:hypothetical protein
MKCNSEQQYEGFRAFPDVQIVSLRMARICRNMYVQILTLFTVFYTTLRDTLDLL